MIQFDCLQVLGFYMYIWSWSKLDFCGFRMILHETCSNQYLDGNLYFGVKRRISTHGAKAPCHARCYQTSKWVIVFVPTFEPRFVCICTRGRMGMLSLFEITAPLATCVPVVFCASRSWLLCYMMALGCM